MDIKDWTRSADFDDLSRDLTSGDFKNNLLESRFALPVASDQKAARSQGMKPVISFLDKVR